MAKYTTLVRSVCEVKAGLDESVGFNSVDDVLADSWDKIFTTRCRFFDETYRSVICKKILKHYYMREIGAESVGLWQLWMNTKLEEIMPYYNKLYESELLEFDPIRNVDLTRTKEVEGSQIGVNERDINRDIDKTESGTVTDNFETKETGDTSLDVTASKSIDSSGTENKDGLKVEMNEFSDTPQSSVFGTQITGAGEYAVNYLTDFRRIKDTTEDDTTTSSSSDESGTSKETGSSSNDVTNKGTRATSKTGSEGFDETRTDNSTVNSTEEYLEHLVGLNGAYNPNKLLEDYRKNILNIDMMIVNEFKDLFMQVW